MSNYVLIAARDPFESHGVGNYYQIAEQLGEAGHTVTCCFIENGVMATRPSSLSDRISSLGKKGVKLVADEFSLQERAITKDQMMDGIETVKIDFIVERLAAGDKAMWY